MDATRLGSNPARTYRAWKHGTLCGRWTHWMRRLYSAVCARSPRTQPAHAMQVAINTRRTIGCCYSFKTTHEKNQSVSEA